MKRSIIIAGGAFALATAGIMSTVSFAPLAAQSSQTAPRAQTTTFAIENMTCALCPVTVKKAMEGVSGVKSVVVDFDAKTATVAFDPSRTTIAAIARASAGAGYPAHVKRA